MARHLDVEIKKSHITKLKGQSPLKRRLNNFKKVKMNLVSILCKYSLSMSVIGFSVGMFKTNNIKKNVLDTTHLQEYPKNEYLTLLSLNNKKNIFSGLDLKLYEESLQLKERIIFSSKYSLDCVLIPNILFMDIEINKIVNKNENEYLFKYYQGKNNNHYIVSESLFN